jgi:hypothetical protein
MLHLLVQLALASSHREAPGISRDPVADITDWYAFVDPTDSDTFVMIMNVNPLELPGGGPNFHGFGDDVRYVMNIDNEGDGIQDIQFLFRFQTEYNYPGDFLYNLGDIGDPANLNVRQKMYVSRVRDGVLVPIIDADDNFYVAPINVGTSSDPGLGYTPEAGAAGSITDDYTYTKGSYKVFAGPRQESFYVDLERTFDLLNLAHGDNTNTLLGYNVHSIAIEVPVAELTKDMGEPDPAAQNEVIATWATTQRRALTSRKMDGSTTSTGPWTQVARLGMPLINEAAIAIADKDKFSASHPSDDIQFLDYVLNPILPVYMEAVLGVPNPVAYDAGLGLGGREDLVLLLLTGHPALGTMPGGYALGGPIPGEPDKLFGAFEALRCNLATASGFPNGRLVAEDVTDVTLSALAGLLIDGTFVSDGVGSDGLYPLDGFPWLGDPWAGDNHPGAFHSL